MFGMAECRDCIPDAQHASPAYSNAHPALTLHRSMLIAHMDFDRLRAFVWTLEEGGVSAAARRLNRTQPAVTRMLQTLEDQLGAQLIDRKARPMRPTMAGRRVLEHARTILNAAERLTDGRANPAAAPQTLRIGVSRSLLWHLRDARFVNPEAPLNATDFFVRSGWSPRLYRRFVRGELDSAVLLMPATWTPDVPYTGGVVRTEKLTLIGPRDRHDAARRTATCEELDAQPWILNPDGCGFRAALSRALASCGRRFHVRFEVDAAPQEHLAMVAAGMGYSIVPSSALNQNERLAANVQQLSVAAFDGSLNVWVIWSQQCQMVDGTTQALAKIFAETERRTPLRLAASPSAGVVGRQTRHQRR
jgi:DNA-binding transcriptional LysR family regulator